MEKYSINSYLNKDDIDWDKVPTAEINQKGWTISPEFISNAKMVFIKGYGFIVKLVCFEKDPWANCSRDKEPVYNDSCLEAFFSFNDEGYINLETNSKSIRLQGFGKGRHNRKSILDLDFNGFKAESCRNDRFWSVTLYIPLNDLTKIYKTLDTKQIDSGFTFRGNFYKTGLHPGDNVDHYYMWNRISANKPDFHRPEQFGILEIK